MKSFAILLAVLVLGVGLSGCKKTQSPPERTVYDEALDGKNPLPVPVLDQALAQPAAPRATPEATGGSATSAPATEGAPATPEATAGAATPEAPAAAALTPQAQQVLAVVASLSTAAASGSPDGMVPFFAPDSGRIIQAVAPSITKAQAALKAYEDAVKTKLGDASLQQMQQDPSYSLTRALAAGPVPPADPAKLRFEQADADTIRAVCLNGGMELVFKQADGKWLAVLAAPGADTAVTDKLTNAITKAVDSVAEFLTRQAGAVNDGTIPADKLLLSFTMSYGQAVAPFHGMMVQAMQEAMPKAAGAGAATPAPGTETPAAPASPGATPAAPAADAGAAAPANP